MAKVPFTSAGVSAKQAEIYALSQTDQDTQIEQIRTDFRTWVIDNFILDTNQELWLANMPIQFQKAFAEELVSALEVQLPVTLQTEPIGTGSKLFKMKKTVEFSLKNGIWTVDDGDFGISISYE